jgi:hypothetical protein
MTRKYTPRNREKLIEQRNENSLTHLLKAKDLTLKDKQTLIKERNPFLHIFGEHLTPQGNNDYATYINHLYIGESK